MSANGKKPLSIDELLERTHPICDCDGEVLKFDQEPEHTVYNITTPFKYKEKWLIAGRTERIDDEISSQTKFYGYNYLTENWHHDSSLPTLPLQDPFVARIRSEWVVGGVKVYPSPDDSKRVGRYDTWLYKGSEFEKLEHFATISNMKDVRLAENNWRIDVLTRPQGERGGLGKIGYVAIKSLNEITDKVVYSAPIVEGLFADDRNEWGGANQIVTMPGGRVGIHGHIARFNGQKPGAEHPNRQYYGLAAVLDTSSLEVSGERILACRKCFPDTQPKRDDLRDVVFMGGISVDGVMYAGIGDHSGARKIVGNTFKSI